MQIVPLEEIAKQAQSRRPAAAPTDAPVPSAGVAQSLRLRAEAIRTDVVTGPLFSGPIPKPTPTPFGISRPGELGGTAQDIERRFGHLRLADRYELVSLPHELGSVHHITHRTTIGVPTLPHPSVARAAWEARLDTIFGVGPVTAERLRAAGMTSVRHLIDLDRYREAALEVVAEHDAPDLTPLCSRFARRLGERGHLLSALACALVGQDDVAFFDLETMGLWNNVVFLAGVGRIREGQFVVDQYLAPGFAGEAAVIALATAALAEVKVVVTYNGRTADLPWLRNRAYYYGTGPIPEFIHVDLVYGTRGRFVRQEQRLPNAQLTVVSEELLGLPRPEFDLDSSLIPAVYTRFTTDPERLQGMLVPILDHNRADLEALVLLLELLCAEALVAG